MNRRLKSANDCLMPNYGELGLEIVSGHGAHAWVKGSTGHPKKCLDLLCGLGVTSLGHCHPVVVAAIRKQAGSLMHVSNLYATKPMAALAERLVKLTGYRGAKVFFCNSGTEANEAAGKLARIWAHEKFGPKKNKIIALKNSFHGRTFLSITMTGQAKMQDKFAPTVPGIEFVALNDVEGLDRAVNDDVCAIIFETIQAEGGVNIMSQKFFEAIGEFAQKHNFLRICDEVQTGMGRTGQMFSYSRFTAQQEKCPDIITLAKALGGGLPIGAVIAKGEVGRFLLAGSHAATFGGNPVVCAAALAVLEVIGKEDLLAQVNNLGGYFLGNLKALSCQYTRKIKEVRGDGLMIGVELQSGYSASSVVIGMREQGILIGTAGPQVVRFLPPFIVTKAELDETLDKFAQVLKKIKVVKP